MSEREGGREAPLFRIADPGAVWDRGDLVWIVGEYQAEGISWPIVRGSGCDRCINPERLVPAKSNAARQWTEARSGDELAQGLDVNRADKERPAALQNGAGASPVNRGTSQKPSSKRRPAEGAG